MSERILNGDFSSGSGVHNVDHWDNGVRGGYAFYYLFQTENIKGISYEDSISEKVYKIKQGFAVNDEVIIAKLSAWGQWQALSGDIDGSNQFIIELKKPDTSMVELLNTTKTALTGSGQLLTESDIKANFDQYGNYELWLTLKTNAKRYDESVSVSEPYNTWDNGGDLFDLYDSNNKIERLSGEADDVEYTATMTKEFTVDKVPHSALLTVQAKGNTEIMQATANARVRIKKKGLEEWNVLYDHELDGDSWSNILNAVDISSYITSSGIWQLQLEARVKSFEVEGQYYIGEVHFGNVDFTANWYEYTISHGWYDDISLNMSVRKYKTVFEAIGATDKPQKFVSKEEKEDVELAEDYSTLAMKAHSESEPIELTELYGKEVRKAIKEDLELGENYFHNRRYKTIKEDIELTESFFTKEDFLHSEKEDVEFGEAYSSYRIKHLTKSSAIELTERLEAKRTHGNLETFYTIDALTAYDGISPVITKWITTKTEIH